MADNIYYDWEDIIEYMMMLVEELCTNGEFILDFLERVSRKMAEEKYK